MLEVEFFTSEIIRLKNFFPVSTEIGGVKKKSFFWCSFSEF